MTLIRASLPHLKAQSPNHGHVYPATNAYYEGPLGVSELDSLLEKISGSQELLGDARACVLLGYGGRPRRTYSELRSNPGVRLLWDGPFLPWPLLRSHGLPRLTVAWSNCSSDPP